MIHITKEIPIDEDHIISAKELIDDLSLLDPDQKILVGYWILNNDRPEEE